MKSYKIVLVISLSMILLLSDCSSVINPNSSSEYRIVDHFGQLKVEGKNILNQQGEVISLEGMSMFWSQWIDKYYNYDCIKWLRDDWHCEVIRVAMAISHGGYLENPEEEMSKITSVIDACIDLGIYVIVDWHSHRAESEVEEAIGFFSDIARRYGQKPNILYEIYNEPLRVSWDKVVKPYHETVIAAIRNYDPDNIIIAGTPSWSQNVDGAAKNPINDENIAYTLHFYAGTHEQWLREKALLAINKNLALWVTEYGTCESNGDGSIAHDELNIWYDFIKEHNLSSCNWSVSDKKETSAVLLPGASPKGSWSESMLSESGKLVREKIRQFNP